MRRKTRQAGFTLTETLIALGMMSIIIAGIAGLLRTSMASYRLHEATVNAEQAAYFAMEMMTRELREARQINVVEEQLINFNDRNDQTIVYTLLSGNRLVRQEGTLTEDLADSVTQLLFETNDPITEPYSNYILIKYTISINSRSFSLENAVYPR